MNFFKRLFSKKKKEEPIRPRPSAAYPGPMGTYRYNDLSPEISSAHEQQAIIRKSSSVTPTFPYDPLMDPLNPISPLSPFNPAYNDTSSDSYSAPDTSSYGDTSSGCDSGFDSGSGGATSDW